VAPEPTGLEALHPEALAELREAVIWYRDHEADAPGFLAEVTRIIEDLARAPNRWPVLRNVRPETHCRVLPSYPYTLFYRAVGDSLLIVSIAHHKREPLYWTHRR
jgi:hypothetical protein